jgi:hypothetical protein
MKPIKSFIKESEDAEQIDELKSSTYRSYIDKAEKDTMKRMDKDDKTDKDRKTMRKRSLGIATAKLKQYGDKRTVGQRIRNEESELDEVKKYKAPTAAEIAADKKKDQKGKAKPSMSAKNAGKLTYKNMMGKLKEQAVELDEAKETTKLIKDLVQIVQDYHNLFSYEDDPNDEYYNAYKDALNQIEKIAGKKVRDQVDKEKPVKRMMSKSSTLDKAKSLRDRGTKKDGTANKNAIKKFKQDILNRISKHTMAMKGKLPEEVELDEAKEHPAYQPLMKLAKDLDGTDTRAIQVMAGKISNFTATGNRGNLADLGKYFKSLDSYPRDAFISVMQKHDKALLKSIAAKAGFGIKEEAELDEGAFKGVGKFLAKRKFDKKSKQAYKDAQKSISKAQKYDFADVDNRDKHEKDFTDKMKKSDRYDRAAKRLNREEVELDEAKEHPAYNDLMKLAKDLDGRDTRAIQVMAGKIANFTATGNRGNISDLGKAFKALDSYPRDAFISIMQKHDKALLKSIAAKAGFGIKEEVELDERVNTDKGRSDLLKIVENVSNAISAHNQIGSDAEKLLAAMPNGVKDYRALYRSLSEAKKVADSLWNNLRNAQRWDAKLLESNNKETVKLDEAVKTRVYKSGKYWLVDVTSSKIDYTDWGPTGRGFASEKAAQEFAKHMQKSVKESVELDEAKADRLQMIRKAAEKIKARTKAAERDAKSAMRSPGAQRGMAPLKKEAAELDEGIFDKLKSAPHIAKAGVAANKGDLEAVKGHVSNAVPNHITGDDREKQMKKHYANISKATKNTSMKTILKKMSESAELDEATDFRPGDTVHEVGSKLKGTVQHKGNRDLIAVKFGSINKMIPASKLRLAEEVELDEMDLSKHDTKKLLQFYRKYADKKMSPSDANQVKNVRRELMKRGALK